MFIHVDPNSRLGKTIIVVGLPLFATFIVFQVVNFSRAIQSYHWPAAAGIVVESKVERLRDAHGIPHSNANVRYTYTVAGRQLENDAIAFGVFRGKLTWGYATAKVARYPQGQGVAVFYNPKSPKVSCLEQGGIGWEDGFMLIVNVSGIVCGMNLVLKGVQRLAAAISLTGSNCRNVS